MVTAVAPFPRELSSVPASRHWLGGVLDSWPLPRSVAEEAVLLANELTTNAVLHAHSGYELEVSLEDGCLRVEVTDHGTDLPRPGVPSPGEPGGRGLGIVEALASSWGTSPAPEGKTVWFELCPVGA